MAKVGQQRLMKGAILLTVTSFIVKILSAIYRVPFQNMVGDEGFYVYQQVYPIYGVAMTLSLSGLPIFLSKLVAEKETTAEKAAVVKGVFPLILWLSIGCFVVTYTGSQMVADLMGDGRLAPLIKVVSFVFLLTPFLTVYRGYYQGELLMAPTAYSQLVEQVLRVAVILLAAYLFTKVGWDSYQMGTIAMSGALIGGIGALLILLWYRPALNFLFIIPLLRCSWEVKPARRYLRRFLIEGSLICGYSALLVLFQLIDSFVIKNQLVLSGMAEVTAKVTKGVYDRGQPLLQVGMVIGVALTTSFLPTLTKYHIEKKVGFYQRTQQLFIKTTLAVSSAASLGLIFLLPYINQSLFGDNGEQKSLSILLIAVFLMTMILVYQTIYQSVNHSKTPLLAITIGLLVKLLSSPFLTYQLGTIGASLATVLGLTVCLLMLSYSFNKKSRTTRIETRFIWKLSQSLGMMSISLWLYQLLVSQLIGVSSHRLAYFLVAVGGVIVGASVFLWWALRKKLFTVREWLTIPLGKKIMRIAKK